MLRVTIVVCWFASSCLAQDTTRLSLLFLGDIMQHDSQLQAAYDATTGQYNYEPCFRYARKYFMDADLTIGNLELTLGAKPYKGYPEFSAPDALAVELKNAGVDVLVTANNHSLDRRRKGLERTIRVLDSLQIMHTGTFRDTVERMNDYPLLISRNGINLALLNYTYGTNGIPVSKPNVVNLIDTAVIRKDLARAAELEPDLVIVFMHWGNEYQRQPSKQQRHLAEFCLRYGANLVIGAHPHVLQPMELRNNKQLVVYSLGNFISGQRDRYRDGAAMVKVEITKVYSSDSLANTFITSAGHILHWVYRTPAARRTFYVLPVPDFENDTTGFIYDEPSKLAFKTFLTDARALLQADTYKIQEIKTPSADTIVRYRISWMVPASEKDLTAGLETTDYYFGIEVATDAAGNQQMTAGSFRKQRDAEAYLERIRKRFPDAQLQEFINRKF
ncbi:MAG: CapA family protein [Cyclobacteriaceae bacterium]|nr:CapA family protein [Cyclobacteriaceae bacterium]